MGKTVGAIIICAAISVVLFGCSSSSSVGVRNDLSDARMAMEQGDYARAEEAYGRAAQQRPSARNYAMAATAAYRANDLRNAELFVDDGLRLEQGSSSYSTSHMRLVGYKALIFLKEGRQQEGMQALDEYYGAYKNYYPMAGYASAQRMASEGPAELPRLERTVEGNIRRYESDMAQYESEGTGYFAEKYGPPIVPSVPEQ